MGYKTLEVNFPLEGDDRTSTQARSALCRSTAGSDSQQEDEPDFNFEQWLNIWIVHGIDEEVPDIQKFMNSQPQVFNRRHRRKVHVHRTVYSRSRLLDGRPVGQYIKDIAGKKICWPMRSLLDEVPGHIVFFATDVGGAFVKEALLQAASSPDPKTQRILHYTRLLVLFGSLHKAQGILESISVLSTLLETFPESRSAWYTKSLAELADYHGKLADQYERADKPYRIISCFQRNSPESHTQIFPESCVRTLAANEMVIGLDRSHFHLSHIQHSSDEEKLFWKRQFENACAQKENAYLHLTQSLSSVLNLSPYASTHTGSHRQTYRYVAEYIASRESLQEWYRPLNRKRSLIELPLPAPSSCFKALGRDLASAVRKRIRTYALSPPLTVYVDTIDMGRRISDPFFATSLVYASVLEQLLRHVPSKVMAIDADGNGHAAHVIRWRKWAPYLYRFLLRRNALRSCPPDTFLIIRVDTASTLGQAILKELSRDLAREDSRINLILITEQISPQGSENSEHSSLEPTSLRRFTVDLTNPESKTALLRDMRDWCGQSSSTFHPLTFEAGDQAIQKLRTAPTWLEADQFLVSVEQGSQFATSCCLSIPHVLSTSGPIVSISAAIDLHGKWLLVALLWIYTSTRPLTLGELDEVVNFDMTLSPDLLSMYLSDSPESLVKATLGTAQREQERKNAHYMAGKHIMRALPGAIVVDSGRVYPLDSRIAQYLKDPANLTLVSASSPSAYLALSCLLQARHELAKYEEGAQPESHKPGNPILIHLSKMTPYVFKGWIDHYSNAHSQKHVGPLDEESAGTSYNTMDHLESLVLKFLSSTGEVERWLKLLGVPVSDKPEMCISAEAVDERELDADILPASLQSRLNIPIQHAARLSANLVMMVGSGGYTSYERLLLQAVEHDDIELCRSLYRLRQETSEIFTEKAMSHALLLASLKKREIFEETLLGILPTIPKASAGKVSIGNNSASPAIGELAPGAAEGRLSNVRKLPQELASLKKREIFEERAILQNILPTISKAFAGKVSIGNNSASPAIGELAPGAAEGLLSNLRKLGANEKSDDSAIYNIVSQNIDAVDFLVRGRHIWVNDMLRKAVVGGDLPLIKKLLEYRDDSKGEMLSLSEITVLALMEGQLEVARHILNVLDPDYQDPETSFLVASSMHGLSNAVRLILDQGADSNAVSESETDSTLHTASANGNLKTVDILLGVGKANPLLTNDKGELPLHLALENGYLDVADILVEHMPAQVRSKELLLERTPSPVLSDSTSESDFSDSDDSFHTSRPEPETRIDDMICPLNVVNTSGLSCFLLAAREGFLSLCRRMVEKGADPGLQDDKGLTALHYAVKLGSLDLVRFLLDHGLDASIQDLKGISALHCAAQSGDKAIVQLLLEHTSNSGLAILGTHWNTHPLIGAITERHTHIVEDLIKACKMAGSDRVLETALHIATKLGHLSIARALLDSGVNVNAQDKYANTAAQIAAYYNYPEILEQLIIWRADLELHDYRERTPLLDAADRGSVKALKVLVSAGANLEALDSDGESPLTLAILGTEAESVKFLLDKGAEPKLSPRWTSIKENSSIFRLACTNTVRSENDIRRADIHKVVMAYTIKKQGLRSFWNADIEKAFKLWRPYVFEVIKFLWDNWDASKLKIGHSGTALHYAAAHHHKDVVETILKHPTRPIDVNTVCGTYGTALQAAASIMPLGESFAVPGWNRAPKETGEAEIAQLLVHMGADPLLRGGVRHTALHAAAFCKNFKTMGFLLSVLAPQDEKEPGAPQDGKELGALQDGKELGKKISKIPRATRKLIREAGGLHGTVLMALVSSPPHPYFSEDRVHGDMRAAFNILVAFGDDVMRKGRQHDLTALHRAAQYGSVKTLTMVMTRPTVDIKHRDIMGRMPIHLTVRQSYPAWGTDKRSNDFTEEERFDRRDIIKTLDPDLTTLWEIDNLGRALLHFAAGAGSIEVVNHILDANEEMTRSKDTLKNASEEEVSAAVMAEKTRLVNQEDHDGWTALHWACRQLSEEMVKLLLGHGADKKRKTLKGWYPWHVALYHDASYHDSLRWKEGGADEKGGLEDQLEYDSDGQELPSSPEHRWDSYCESCQCANYGDTWFCTHDECPSFSLCFKCYPHVTTGPLTIHPHGHVFVPEGLQARRHRAKRWT